MWLLIMKIIPILKNRSSGKDISESSRRHTHKYTRYRKCIGEILFKWSELMHNQFWKLPKKYLISLEKSDDQI